MVSYLRIRWNLAPGGWPVLPSTRYDPTWKFGTELRMVPAAPTNTACPHTAPLRDGRQTPAPTFISLENPQLSSLSESCPRCLALAMCQAWSDALQGRSLRILTTFDEHHSHGTTKDMKAQRGEGNCLRSHSQEEQFSLAGIRGAQDGQKTRSNDCN